DVIIEEVTTDLEGSSSNPTVLNCPNPEAKACFVMCRLAPRACASECGCDIYIGSGTL
ncbi:hypothetical protein FRX31_021272, partial [Thalictrum thalictroides]